MKLSDAIRAGAAITEPLKHGYFRYAGDHIYACALGAAVYAEFGKVSTLMMLEAEDQWPILDVTVLNPVSGDMVSIEGVIFDLNDKHGWSREKIAAWIDSIGMSGDSVPTDQVEVAVSV